VVNDLPPRFRKIAMVFQSYALSTHDSSKHRVSAQSAETLQIYPAEGRLGCGLFNIDHLLDRKPRQLSGGERQRVAHPRRRARTRRVSARRTVSNLDAKLRYGARRVEAVPAPAWRDHDRTHDQVEAMGMGDRVAVMSQGQIQQLGTPQELYRAPANTFVATFLGSPPMNLIEKDSCLIGFHPEHFLRKTYSGWRRPVTSHSTLPRGVPGIGALTTAW
jgi:multiple sugar transport system ATP-binding protein